MRDSLRRTGFDPAAMEDRMGTTEPPLQVSNIGCYREQLLIPRVPDSLSWEVPPPVP